MKLVIAIAVLFLLIQTISCGCTQKKVCTRKQVGPYTRKDLTYKYINVRTPYVSQVKYLANVVECYQKSVRVRTPYKVRVKRSTYRTRKVKKTYRKRIAYKGTVKRKFYYKKSFLVPYRATCYRQTRKSYQKTLYRYVRTPYKATQRYSKLITVYRMVDQKYRTRVSYSVNVKQYYLKRVRALVWGKQRYFIRYQKDNSKPNCWKKVFGTRRVRVPGWKKVRTYRWIKKIRQKYVIRSRKVRRGFRVRVTRSRTVTRYRNVRRAYRVPRYKYVRTKYGCTKRRRVIRRLSRWRYYPTTLYKYITAFKLVNQRYKYYYWYVDTRYTYRTVKRAATRNRRVSKYKKVIKYRNVRRRVQVAKTVAVKNYQNSCLYRTYCTKTL